MTLCSGPTLGNSDSFQFILQLCWTKQVQYLAVARTIIILINGTTASVRYSIFQLLVFAWLWMTLFFTVLTWVSCGWICISFIIVRGNNDTSANSCNFILLSSWTFSLQDGLTLALLSNCHCSNSTWSCIAVQSFNLFACAQYDGFSLANYLFLLRLNSCEEIFAAPGIFGHYLRRFNSDKLLLPHSVTSDHHWCSWLF